MMQTPRSSTCRLLFRGAMMHHYERGGRVRINTKNKAASAGHHRTACAEQCAREDQRNQRETSQAPERRPSA